MTVANKYVRLTTSGIKKMPIDDGKILCSAAFKPAVESPFFPWTLSPDITPRIDLTNSTQHLTYHKFSVISTVFTPAQNFCANAKKPISSYFSADSPTQLAITV